MSNFSKIMRSKSDEQLIEILTRYRSDFDAAAVEAARDEVIRRDLKHDHLVIVHANVDEKFEHAEAKAAIPLDAGWKVLAFLILGVINLLAAATRKVDGYERKYRELKRWTFYGAAFYLVVILLVVNL